MSFSVLLGGYLGLFALSVAVLLGGTVTAVVGIAWLVRRRPRVINHGSVPLTLARRSMLLDAQRRQDTERGE